MQYHYYRKRLMKKCGIILMNTDTNQYLLVFGNKSQKWGFPKGHMENGENEQETALRELYEETGIMLNNLDTQNKVRFRNNVYFEVSLTSSNLPKEFIIHDQYEIGEMKWFTEQDILSMDLQLCNFGLKNWINYKMMNEKEYKNIDNPSFIKWKDVTSCSRRLVS